jgi:thiol-disulfide isomerase/thioredoxin
MKKLVSIFIILISAAATCFSQSNSAVQNLDSTVLKALDAKINEYVAALEPEPLDVKQQECDFMIENTSDSLLRQYVAIKLYDHYLNSPVMGDEAVSIHILDTWFAPGKVSMQSDIELMNAQIYADFNRQSLLGCQAPELTLFDTDSTAKKVVFTRYTVLYFYDTECSKCKMESVFLKPLLDRKNYPIDFYAVYTGVNKDSWLRWIGEKLNISAPETKIINLWDPEVSSDYQMKYGVLSTPQMFLVNPSGKIVGRGLDHSALEQLLDIYLASQDYEYGGEDTKALYDELFKSYGDTLEADDVMHTAELVKSKTLDKGDTLFYKHLEGDLLYYLSNHKGEEYNAGALRFIDEYILGRSDVWRTADDSLKVIGLADMMHGLLSRTPIGSKLPKDMPIDGWRKFLRKGGYLVFHTAGCEVCRNELKALDSLQASLPKGRRLKVLEVNTTELFDSKPESMTPILDTFDLSSMPYIMKIGRGGVVQRKYITFLK